MSGDERLRAVVDTHEFLYAFAARSSAERLVIAWLENRFDLVISREILAEVQNTMHLVRNQYRLNRFHIALLMAHLGKTAIVVVPTSTVQVVAADPSDDKFIHAALAGEAGYIVTEDKHLLGVGNHQGVEIVRADRFLGILDSRAAGGKRKRQ